MGVARAPVAGSGRWPACVGGARAQRVGLAKRARAGDRGAVGVAGAHQQDARFGGVAERGLEQVAGAEVVDGVGEGRGAARLRDRRDGGQVDDQTWFGGAEGGVQGARVGDVDLAVDGRHVPAGELEFRDQMATHEAPGPGHERAHGSRLPDPRAVCYLGRMIFGVAGLNGAGKGEVVRFLETRSFTALSLSDVIRAELEQQGLEETRERMIEAGNALRTAEGPGALAQRLANTLLPDRNYVIDSVRHPAEVEVLRTRTQRFKLLWVEADEATRLERIRARGRSGDPETAEDLRRLENMELGSQDPATQQLRAVRTLADFILTNDSTLEELRRQTHDILTDHLFFERPSWDEYFMSIARVVASRSNCVKRRVGAVIVIDRRVVSTGYNGTPRGVRNCNEGGCSRCNAFAEGGTRLDECLCSHAEENSITQAAYHGVSVRGGALFTTLSPCLICTKMIINAGIDEVAYNADYPMGDVSLSLLREAGVKVRQV